jgi:hypothetical protein
MADMLEAVSFSGQMLDDGKYKDGEFRNIQYLSEAASSPSAYRPEGRPETRIQDRSILAMVFIAAVKFDHIILL